MIMTDSPIRFPGLFGDWAFTASSKAINIGNGIYWYGIILACAMLAAALTLMDDARATCPLYTRTGAWRYACQTTDTLVTALMRAFPGCDERGTEIYFDLTR